MGNIVAQVEAVVPRTTLGAAEFRHDNRVWDPAGLEKSRTFMFLLAQSGSVAGFQDCFSESAEYQLALDLAIAYELRAGNVALSLSALAEDSADVIRSLERADGYDAANTKISQRTCTQTAIQYRGDGFAVAQFRVSIRYVE